MDDEDESDVVCISSGAETDEESTARSNGGCKRKRSKKSYSRPQVQQQQQQHRAENDHHPRQGAYNMKTSYSRKQEDEESPASSNGSYQRKRPRQQVQEKYRGTNYHHSGQVPYNMTTSSPSGGILAYANQVSSSYRHKVNPPQVPIYMPSSPTHYHPQPHVVIYNNNNQRPNYPGGEQIKNYFQIANLNPHLAAYQIIPPPVSIRHDVIPSECRRRRRSPSLLEGPQIGHFDRIQESSRTTGHIFQRMQQQEDESPPDEENYSPTQTNLLPNPLYRPAQVSKPTSRPPQESSDDEVDMITTLPITKPQSVVIDLDSSEDEAPTDVQHLQQQQQTSAIVCPVVQLSDESTASNDIVDNAQPKLSSSDTIVDTLDKVFAPSPPAEIVQLTAATTLSSPSSSQSVPLVEPPIDNVEAATSKTGTEPEEEISASDQEKDKESEEIPLFETSTPTKNPVEEENIDIANAAPGGGGSDSPNVVEFASGEGHNDNNSNRVQTHLERVTVETSRNTIDSEIVVPKSSSGATYIAASVDCNDDSGSSTNVDPENVDEGEEEPALVEEEMVDEMPIISISTSIFESDGDSESDSDSTISVGKRKKNTFSFPPLSNSGEADSESESLSTGGKDSTNIATSSHPNLCNVDPAMVMHVRCDQDDDSEQHGADTDFMDATTTPQSPSSSPSIEESPASPDATMQDAEQSKLNLIIADIPLSPHSSPLHPSVVDKAGAGQAAQNDLSSTELVENRETVVGNNKKDNRLGGPVVTPASSLLPLLPSSPLPSSADILRSLNINIDDDGDLDPTAAAVSNGEVPNATSTFEIVKETENDSTRHNNNNEIVNSNSITTVVVNKCIRDGSDVSEKSKSTELSPSEESARYTCVPSLDKFADGLMNTTAFPAPSEESKGIFDRISQILKHRRLRKKQV